MQLELPRFTVLCGHYGVGKTNFSINLALKLRARGERVTLVDLDIVNPYFRSSDYNRLLVRHDVKVIAPMSAGTTQDLPSVSAEVYSVFNQPDGYVLFDVGGDDAGATALGRFSPHFRGNEYAMLYIINRYRISTQTAQEAADVLQEIQEASRLLATGIANNSHLSSQTVADDVLNALPFAREIADMTELPLVCTTAPASIAPELTNIVPDLFPVELFVRTPWQ